MAREARWATYSPWDHKESDTTERLTLSLHFFRAATTRGHLWHLETSGHLHLLPISGTGKPEGSGLEEGCFTFSRNRSLHLKLQGAFDPLYCLGGAGQRMFQIWRGAGATALGNEMGSQAQAGVVHLSRQRYVPWKRHNEKQSQENSNDTDDTLYRRKSFFPPLNKMAW